MKYLFDTDVVSFLYTPSSALSGVFLKKFSDMPYDTEFQISVLTLYELAYSYSNALKAKQNEIRGTIQSVENKFDIVPLEKNFALHYGELKTLLKQFKNIKSKSMKKYNIDLMIASSAIGENSVLISNDRVYKDLAALYPQLRVEDWMV